MSNNKKTKSKNSKKRKRAYGYVRKSPNNYVENTSIEKQIEEIEKYCELNDIELIEIYTDDLVSAKSFEGRDGFKEMYNNVLRSVDDVDYIVVFKQDRISRDTLDTLFIMKRLNSIGKHLISIVDNVNTEDPTAKILVHVLALVAELEREFINIRTFSGMEKRADEGHFLGGKVFGYKTHNKELVIVPEEAKIVKYIFEKYAIELWGYKKIASTLNLQGFRTKNNKYWTINAVKTILENKLYIGYTKWKGKYQKGIHTSIIENTLWEKTQEVMKARSYTQQKIHPGSYPLSGLLKCPECGSPMVQGNSSSKYKYYQCCKNKNSGAVACSSNLVKKEYAEATVLNEVTVYLKDINLFQYLESATNSFLSMELEPLQKEADKIEKQIKHIKEKMLTVIDLMDDSSLSLDEELLKNKLFSHQEDLNERNMQLEEIKRQIRFKEDHASCDIINFCAVNFLDFYETITDAEKKSLLNYLIKEIDVYKGDTTKDRQIKSITYNFSPDDLSLV
ncbi:recombinase family protein [Bacillus sp. BRMEA1]|uniref:recombinase family protein n=1 Tax=Neobacillus endophyticus TaxID=2738405 RepID=UPI001566F209|nr:recombinase family protein [Neobacillus endophyticus]NRD77385.1 recombinase family protein [Neobacillus endophyticus]